MGFGFRLGFLQNELVKALHIARLAPAFRGFVAIGNGQHDFFAFGEFVFGIGDDEIGFRKRFGVEVLQYAVFNRLTLGFHCPADFHIGKVRKQVLISNRIGLCLRIFFHCLDFRIDFFHFVIRGVGFAVGADDAVCAEIGVAAGHSRRVRQLQRSARLGLFKVRAVKPVVALRRFQAKRLVHKVPNIAAAHMVVRLEIVHIFLEVAEAVFHRVRIFAKKHRFCVGFFRNRLGIRRELVCNVVVKRNGNRLFVAEFIHGVFERIHSRNDVALG